MSEFKDTQKSDASIYAKPEFTAKQMSVIKIGIERGFDPTSFAKPELDIEEMSKIVGTILW